MDTSTAVLIGENLMTLWVMLALVGACAVGAIATRRR